MKLLQAKRLQAKIKMALQGPSGSGKTYGALLLAYGLCKSWSRIAVIDTENYSASLYAHLGNYSIVNIAQPYSPEKYIEAIKLCETSGIEVIIIDSISHEWEGVGGILETHAGMQGNSFTNWGKLTPRHNGFVQTILQSQAHVIATIRSKQDYIISEKNGKQVPEKVGMKGVTRDGMDYEFTCVFDLNIKHFAAASKDRTGLFMDQPEFKVTAQIGEKILAWCNQGEPFANEVEEFTERINSCLSVDELYKLYKENPDFQNSYHAVFLERKNVLLASQKEITPALFTKKLSKNGNNNFKQ